RCAAAYIETNANGKSCDVLDFGCGTGLFSYHLASKGHRVLALDLDLTPVKMLESQIEYPEKIEFAEGDFLAFDFGDRRFDFISALDVLEHIPLDELPKYLEKFAALLKPNGAMVVSGPTENFLYKLGRRLAGGDFTGAYHETTIAKIKKVFENGFSLHTIRRLIWPLTLFEVFAAR